VKMQVTCSSKTLAGFHHTKWHYTPKSSTHWKGDWVGPKSQYGCCWEEKISCSCRESNHSPAVQPSHCISKYSETSMIKQLCGNIFKSQFIKQANLFTIQKICYLIIVCKHKCDTVLLISHSEKISLLYKKITHTHKKMAV
jgi:hypothetical protein